MALNGRRIWLTIVAVGVFLLTFASLASACNEPAIGVSRTQAGPGDIVPFSFTGTDTDATYTVSVGGQTVASGASSGPTVSGTFVMPNLGSSMMRINVEGFVSDPAESAYGWPSSAAIQYVPPAPPPTPTSTAPPPAQAPQSASAPANQAASPAPSAPATGAGPSPTPPPGPGPGHTPPPRGGPPHNPPGDLKTASSQRAPASNPGRVRAPHVSPPATLGTTPAAATGASSATAAPTVAATRVIGAPSANSARLATSASPPPSALARVGHSGSRARAARSPAPVASASARGTNGISVRKGADSVPVLVGAALLGLLALGGSGAAAARMVRRRRPKNSPFTAAVGGVAAEPPSGADAMLRDLDLDAELRSLLAQADGREPEEVAETDRSQEVVSAPS